MLNHMLLLLQNVGRVQYQTAQYEKKKYTKRLLCCCYDEHKWQYGFFDFDLRRKSQNVLKKRFLSYYSTGFNNHADCYDVCCYMLYDNIKGSEA